MSITHLYDRRSRRTLWVKLIRVLGACSVKIQNGGRNSRNTSIFNSQSAQLWIKSVTYVTLRCVFIRANRASALPRSTTVVTRVAPLSFRGKCEDAVMSRNVSDPNRESRKASRCPPHWRRLPRLVTPHAYFTAAGALFEISGASEYETEIRKGRRPPHVMLSIGNGRRNADRCSISPYRK